MRIFFFDLIGNLSELLVDAQTLRPCILHSSLKCIQVEPLCLFPCAINGLADDFLVKCLIKFLIVDRDGDGIRDIDTGLLGFLFHASCLSNFLGLLLLKSVGVCDDLLQDLVWISGMQTIDCGRVKKVPVRRLLNHLNVLKDFLSSFIIQIGFKVLLQVVSLLKLLEFFVNFGHLRGQSFDLHLVIVVKLFNVQVGLRSCVSKAIQDSLEEHLEFFLLGWHNFDDLRQASLKCLETLS